MKRDNFLIRNGDRVVFWGDSITDNSHWCRTIESFVRCRYPRRTVDFWNLGWAGDTSQGGKLRMRRDLPPTKPTLVFIKLGMNDGAYQPFERAGCDAYIDGIREMLRFIRDTTSARVVLVTTVPYETGMRSDAQGRALDRCYPETLRAFSDALVRFAAKAQCGLIDLCRLYQDEIDAFKRVDPGIGFSEDGVHPGPDGNALIAGLLLRAMGASSPALELEIDWKRAKPLKAVGQKALRLRRAGQTLALERRPEAFPFAYSGSELLRVQLSDWQRQLNANVLRVRGLPSRFAFLRVGGRAVAAFSREALERGVDLGGIDLPEKRLGAFISLLVAEKHAARYRRWRALGAFRRGEDAEADYLGKLSSFQANYLNAGKLVCAPYSLELSASDTDDLFAAAPFKVLPPYPNDDEVQILFEIDTTPWIDIVSKRIGKTVTFTPPLCVKGDFSQWALLALSNPAGDGLFRGVANVQRSRELTAFSFDDASPDRASAESEVTRLIKIGLHDVAGVPAGHNFGFIPDDHKIVRITREHFEKAIALGTIAVAPPCV